MLPELHSKDFKPFLKFLHDKEKSNFHVDKDFNKTAFHIFIYDSSTYRIVPVSKDTNEDQISEAINSKLILTIHNEAERSSLYQTKGSQQIIQVGLRTKKKLIEQLKNEHYFNKFVYANLQKSNRIDKIKQINGFSCAVYNAKDFKIPSLLHIVTIYLHRNIRISNQQDFQHTKVTYLSQSQVIANLELPWAISIDLMHLATSCRRHKQPKLIQNLTLACNRFFLRENSDLKNWLNTLDYAENSFTEMPTYNPINNKHLLFRPQKDSLCMKLLMNQHLLPKALTCKSFEDQCLSSFTEVESYD